MNYSVVSSDFLAHHGIIGMRWGVRRYQNNDGSLTPAGEKRYSSAGKIKKNLIKLDKQSANEQFKYKEADRKMSVAQRKAEKYEEKGKTQKADKYKSKADSYKDERNRAEQNINNINKQTNDIINKAINSGYKVKMTQVTRTPSYVKGMTLVTYLGLGVAPAFIYNSAKNKQYDSYGGKASEGFKYKVTKSKDKGKVTIDPKKYLD